MVSAVSNAVIRSVKPDNYGKRMEYSFKCDSCGYVEPGSKVYIFTRPGENRLGTVRCEGRGDRKTPVFHKS